MALRASDIDALLSPAPVQSRPRGLRASDIDALIGAPTLNARASGSAGAVNKKAEAIWGGSFDDWKKRKEADDAERARMVAESEAGNVGSRRAQDFQRKVAALNKEGDQTGDYSADSLRAGRSLEMGMEQGREQIGAGLQFAGETPLALADFFGRIRPKGETEQDRSNPVTEAGKDIRGAAVARQQEIAPLMIDRPESLLSVQGAKYIAQSALQSAPTTGTGLAAAVINPAAGLTLMGAGAGSAKFADARAEDKGYWLSAEAGAAAAAAEVVPEMLPLGFLSGRLLKHLPGTAMKRLASSPAGRGALLSLSEGASGGVTELSNIAYEIAREGKTYTDEQIANRLIDATTVETVMGGGMAAIAEATGQSARAYDQSKIADLELENSLRAAIKPRATTARILGPTATPDAAAGAQIADDAFRSAGVGTVAAADIAEQDALARDLDAAQRDQLGSEAEIDRLLTGNTPRERTDLYRASIPGAIPQGVQVTSNQDAFAAPGTIGGRDAPAPIQVTTLADRSVFVPGDPAAIRQKLADAGSQWQGMAQERDGVAGVRFSPTSWTDVQGLIGGGIAPTANAAPEVTETPAVAPPLDLTARRTNSDTKFDERIHDLTDFIALNGGLDRSALEAEGIDPANWNSRKAKAQNDKFFGKPLFRKTGGMTLETLREKARDAGFRTDKDVLDLIGDSLGGRKTFTPAGSEYQMALADVARQEADAQARQQRVNALPLSVPETDADAYIASRETEFDAPADRDVADLADIESTLASVADTGPQQRASVVSLGHDYTAKLIELKRARAAGALNPDQQEAYIDLLERDRETGKVAGRPMAGIGNKTAYVDALMQGKLMPVQAFLDADNFKALNDKFGHDVGDDVIRLIADVVRAEFGEGNVFHRGGDEFLTQGMTQEEVDAKMARVQDYLARVKMELPLSDGRTATLTGVGVSYGTGANEKAADDSLKQDKQRRKDAGLRFDRREGDDAGRVGSQSSGAGTEASGANSRDSSRAAAEGVGDERQEGGRVQSGDAGNGSDLGGSGPRTEAVRGGQAGSREVSGGIATVRSAISQALGAKFLRRLESQPWFHLVGTLADLPANIRKSITDGGNVAGFVLGNDVYIIADQASDPVGVTLHEVGVHFGMSGILGDDFPAVLRNFKRQRAKDAAVGRAYERATEAAERGEDGELTADALATLDEEALAYYVEANWNAKDSRGIVAKVIDAIKSMLNRLGIPLSTLNASPEMLRKVAIGAARKAADGRVSVGKGGGLRYHKAWHGSPHDFDKFRLDDSTIGTGEGAQAFGHGLYFAGRKELGEYYRDTLTNRDPNGYALAHLNAKNVVARMGGDAEWAAEVISDQLSSTDESDPNHQRLTDTLAIIKSGEYAEPLKNAGRLYEVELAPNESDYLDWDAPLSEQSSKVQQSVYNLLTDLGVSSTVANYYASSKSGADVYREISRLAGGDKAASTKLRSEQVPGIRYLDGSSRGGKTGWRVKFKNGQYSGKVFDTKAEADAAVERGEYNMVDRVEKIDDLSHNFVIFDDSQVEVKAKYSRRAGGGGVGGMTDTINVDGVDRPVANSRGKPIASTDAGLRAFWRWFGDSKIVDDDGRPLVVLHGGAEEVDSFDPSMQGDASSGAGIGYWFTTSVGYASEYAQKTGGGPDGYGVIGHYYIAAPRAIVARSPRGDGMVVDGERMDWEDNLDAINYATTRNRADAIHFKDGSFTDEEAVVVFDPKRIRPTDKPFDTESDTRQAPPREGLGASGPRYSRKTIEVDGKQRPTTDSTGKAIHPTEEGVRNFWRWFGSSKITDASAVVKARDDVRAAQSKLDFDDSRLASLADTHPLYPIITRSRAKHATELDDAKTYLAAVQASPPPVQVFHGGGGHIDAFRRKSRAIWMAESVAANTYGDGVGGTIYPLYARIENPMVFDAEGGTWQQLEFEGERVSTDDLADIAESRGHDGLVINNLRDEDTDDGGDTPATHYAVFAPEQVKSSTGNTGTFSPTDARIAYSRKTPAEARAESAQKQADLGAQLVVSPGQSFVYTDKFTDDWRGQTLKMRERIQDKLLSVRNVQQDIEKIRGAIQDAMNVYRRENLMHGRVGDQRDKLQDTHVKPLIEAMAEAKVSPALLEDYLEARHAKERNEKIAATKGGMPDGASGMTTAQAEDFLQGRAAGHRSGVTLDPAMTRQVSRLGRKVYAITAETRRRLLDSGQITQEAFDALENAYAAYVPLRGKDGTESGKGRGTGKGIDVRGKPIQRAAGRGEGNRAQNILAEVIADAERSIINAEKLRVGRTLARLVLENPNPDVWAIEPVKTELKVSDGTPEEIYEAVKNLDQEEGTIIVKVKGKPYRIVIEDQRMADALKNMAVETVPEVIQYVAGLNRYFSAVLTRYNPSFVGVNMTRDLLFGMTGIWAEHGTAAAAKAAASYFPAMRAAWRDIQGKPPVNAMGRYAREFAEAGGKTYFGKLENVSDMSQRIGEEFKTFRQMAMPKFLGGEMSPVRALAKVARDSKMVQAIEAVNDTVENTLRLSVYAARREAGASIEQAAEYAKNISVNFNRRGSATSWLNALYLFFNAATQGAHRTLTLLKNPKVQGVLGGLAALQATSAMFLMGLDDEDGEPLWDSISSWDKQRNLILAIPIKRENGWGATVIKIPMPYGFNLFPYMGGRSVELARDLQEKPAGRAIADYTTDAVVGVAQAMSPIPFDDGWKAALPHWVRIFTVLSENKDDLGIPIRAGDQYDSFDKPRSASGRDDTPLPFKVAATALNRLGGGDDYTPPYAKFALDWAPEDLAYLFKTFAGGLGSNVVKSGTLTEKLIAGVPVNFKDVPVLSSFVSNVDQRQATSTRYYDHKDDIEREVARQRDLAKETGEVGDNQMGIKIARNKSGVKVKRGEGYELEGKPGSLFDTYKQAEKDISRIRDEMRAAFNDQSISYTERIRKIDELKAEREEVQRELNAAWREQRKKRTQ